MFCSHCEEEILAHEIIPEAGGKLHAECLIRTIAGSVEHQKRASQACDGNCRDDENLTTRQNAMAAARYFCDLHAKRAVAQFN